MGTNGEFVTTQGTGKGIKLLRALCIVGLLVCGPWLVIAPAVAGEGNEASYALPVLGIGSSISGLIIARMMKWWRHD